MTLISMSSNSWRVLLSPITSWRAVWAVARSKRGISFDTAWRQARLARHPDELVYRQWGHAAPDLPAQRTEVEKEEGKGGEPRPPHVG